MSASPTTDDVLGGRAAEPSALDREMAVLKDAAPKLATIPAAERAALLRECLGRIADAAPAWVATGCKAKQLPAADAAEEWLAGPITTLRTTRLLAESLEAIAASGRPPLGSRARQRKDGRLEIDLFPPSGPDRIAFAGFSGHVVMEQGIDQAEAKRRQAGLYHKRAFEGGVSVILGAGNVSSIPPLDALTKIFNEGLVSIIKMNPVNAWSGPFIERAFAPLIDRNLLRVVYGDGDVGRYLVEHEAADDVHITGSDKTHDMIVWGPPGPERERRLAANEPRLEKPISSELGNVSPVVIVPYSYSDDELGFQARNVASMVANNASFNCNAAKMLVVANGWSQRAQFLDLVSRYLSRIPTRVAYYPGARERYEALTRGRNTERIGGADEERLPWTLIHDVDASRPGDPLFSTEPFCSILSVASIASADPVDFLSRATGFMNDTLWGTLNAAIVIHPDLERDTTVGAALATAIDKLRYGTVAINHWPALCYGTGSMPWGGHPSANLRNIQSGLGWVHNTLMLDGIEKSVIRGPLRARPTPVWFYDNPKSVRVCEKLIEMERNPSWWRLPGLILGTL